MVDPVAVSSKEQDGQEIIIKYFGEREKLYNVLLNCQHNYGQDCVFDVKESCGDYTLKLFLAQDEGRKQSILRDIVCELKDNIYAEFDTTLSQRLFDLLRLKNKKLCTAESFTAGRIISSVIQNSGASNYVHEGIVAYSNQSKVERLGVKECDLKREGAVSAVVAYQMVAGLLLNGECDLAISTTGIAGPKSDNTLKPVGLCYIGVGMKDRVDTYKYQFSGTREEITETAVNTALFLAIKKLKRI